jgi:hypothetical protein
MLCTVKQKRRFIGLAYPENIFEATEKPIFLFDNTVGSRVIWKTVKMEVVVIIAVYSDLCSTTEKALEVMGW